MMSRVFTRIACVLIMAGVILPSVVFAGSATVSWQPNTEPDFAKYRVYWSTTSGSYGNYKAEVPKGTTTQVADGLTEGQTYYFVVTALDGSGNESGFSSPPATKTIPGAGALPAPVLTSPANGAHVPGTSITFKWQAAQGANDYNIKIYLTSGAVAFDGWIGNTTSYTINGFSDTGKAFTWAITARNSTGQGPSSPQWSFTNDSSSGSPTLPPAPVLTSPADGANVPGTSVTFTWQSAQGATDYNLKVTDSNGGATFDSWVGNVQSSTVSGLPNNGKSFLWTVTARNQAGQGPASAQRTFVNGNSGTPSTPPPAPALLTPSDGAHVPGTSLAFTWQAAQGATDYNIKIYLTNGAVAYDKWVGNVLSHSIDGFSNGGKAFLWAVSARNQAGQGPSSPQWDFINDNSGGTSPTVPPAPALISPADGANVPGTSVTFTWQSAQGATDYDLKVTDSNGGAAFESWVGNVQSFTVNGLPNNGASFIWTVTAKNQAGQGPASAQRKFVNGNSGTPSAPPPAPALLTPSDGAHVPGTSLTFTWQTAQGATDYNIKVYTSNGAVAYDRWVGNVQTHTIDGFSDTGRTFKWAVTARNQAGQGSSSPQWSFTNDNTGGGSTKVPPAPVLLTPANGARVPGRSVTFTWQAAQGATNYKVRVYTSSGSVAFDRWVGNTQRYTVNGFDGRGKTYTWSVTASNAAGQGPASATRSFVNR